VHADRTELVADSIIGLRADDPHRHGRNEGFEIRNNTCVDVGNSDSFRIASTSGSWTASSTSLPSTGAPFSRPGHTGLSHAQMLAAADRRRNTAWSADHAHRA
jgi:hypothetical protein